jgi:hypothetical protein
VLEVAQTTGVSIVYCSTIGVFGDTKVKSLMKLSLVSRPAFPLLMTAPNIKRNN